MLNDLQRDNLILVGIVIALFSVFSTTTKGSVVFWVTGVSAIIFSIYAIVLAFKVIGLAVRR